MINLEVLNQFGVEDKSMLGELWSLPQFRLFLKLHHQKALEAYVDMSPAGAANMAEYGFFVLMKQQEIKFWHELAVAFETFFRDSHPAPLENEKKDI